MPPTTQKSSTSAKSPEKSSSRETASQTSGVRHVGRTLESDPEYNEQPSRELAPAIGLISRGGNDLSATPDMRDSAERMAETVVSSVPEPLKTRLPGDTRSDPHTDLGPDTAARVQYRGERKGSHGRSGSPRRARK